MSDQDRQPLPEDPPVTVAEDEVERLLAQAQALAEEIASVAGVESDKREPDASAGASGGAETDPLAASQSVEQAMASVQDLVGEVEAEAGSIEAKADAKGPQAPAAEPAGSGPEGTAESDAEANKASLARDGSGSPVPDGSAARPSETSGGASSMGDLGDLTFEDDLCGDVNVDLGEPPETAAGEAEAAGKGESEPDGPRPKRSIKERLTAARTLALQVARPMAVAVPNAILQALVVLDRPFAGLSPTAKQRIGTIAVITVLMGIASWVLPSLFEHNPYEAIEN